MLRAAAGLVFAVGTLGCSSIQPSSSPAVPSPTAVAPSPTIGPTPFPTSEVSLEDATSCPTTRGGPGPTGAAQDQFFGWASSFGNDGLWVGGLWADGILMADPRFVDADGRISMKFGWWHTVPGKLEITGRRLDAAAPPAIGDVPDGYGQTGFQASLTFVTFVIRVPAVISAQRVVGIG
jgi:hypothetical protein